MPLDFIACLAALVPKPRVNLTRYHGVFAPNSHLRAQVLPAQHVRRTDEEADRMATAGHAAMTWAQRLRRVFKIDTETCDRCGGAVKIIVCIEDPMVIETTAWMQEVEQRREQLPEILTHLNKKAAGAKPARLPESRVPPQSVLCDGP